MKLNYFSKTVVGLVRKANEDCIGSIITPNKSNINLRIVCDGMGGHIGGAKASRIAVKSIQEYFLNNPNPVPQIALNEAISFANLQIFGSAETETEFKGMGTTCTVLLENEGLIYIAHVGDSRIYIHTDQKLYRITKDHSYVQELVDKGEITDQQMETHPNKNQLTRALGIAEEVEVEVVSKPILAKAGDTFLMCSDGLNGLINDQMISSVLNTDVELETKVNNLIGMAETAGGHDNISVDLIKVVESEHIKTQFVNKNNVDLIDTKTQQIVIENHKQAKISLKSLKNIMILSSVLIMALFVAYFTFIYNPSIAIEVTEEEVIAVEEIPIHKIDTIKVFAEKGWGTNQLNSKFKTEVKKKTNNYCKDCPLFYRKGKDKPLSIQQYREEVKNLGVGDYLIVTLTDGEINMPEINIKNNTDEERDTNIYSEEAKRKEEEQKKKVEEEKRKKKEQEEQKNKEDDEKKERLKEKENNNSIQVDGSIKIENSTKDSSETKKKNKRKKNKNNSKSDQKNSKIETSSKK
jgi:serine/threonine protein phosphatase PrpC